MAESTRAEHPEAEPANRPKAGKRPPTRTSWQKGQSGNPAGRKPNGQSLAEVFASLTDKTADELSTQVGGSSTWLGRILADQPTGVPLRELVALRVLAALMINPSAGLLNALLRSELPAAPGAQSSPSELDDADAGDDEDASLAPPQ